MNNQFIEKAIEIHGNKYDYSKVEYVNCDTKLIIKCNDCLTEFEQTPYSHINKKFGCIKCGHIKRTEKTLNLRLNEFIEKAIKIHGNKYDYSKVIYINSKTPVIIICNVCNSEFEQIRNTHLTGNGGCKKCSKINFIKNRSFTKEIFIERAKKIHGENFNYSKVNYINSQTNIEIICNTCNNEFKSLPNNHLRGGGCMTCAKKKNGLKKRKLVDKFIEECQKIHKDENELPIYDYSQIDYVNSTTKIIIICKIHGKFEQCPTDHISGKGCNECGILKRTINQTFTQKQFIEKAFEKHGNKYDYSEVKYINSQTKIIIKCNACNFIFKQQPSSHLQGCGCDKCAHKINHNNQKLTENIIIQRSINVHGDKYDYSSLNYINSHTPINIICKKCNNNFQQLYSNHINQKQGCPQCGSRKTEKKILEYLISIYPNIIKEYKVEWCKNKTYLPFDFVIPEYNIIIELDGLQHFKQIMNWKSPEENLITDKYKMKCANDNNYSIIRILQEDVFYDKYDWYNELIQNIEKIKNEEIIQNIYMCKNNEYIHFEA
jgi:very-short-patch-repair endonuclease